MARYINADKMREEWLENGENEFIYDTNSVLDSIDSQPTADVAPVVHGRWIKRDNEKKCSVCGFIYYSNNDDWNGCPNCLAKMDEK